MPCSGKHRISALLYQGSSHSIPSSTIHVVNTNFWVVISNSRWTIFSLKRHCQSHTNLFLSHILFLSEMFSGHSVLTTSEAFFGAQLRRHFFKKTFLKPPNLVRSHCYIFPLYNSQLISCLCNYFCFSSWSWLLEATNYIPYSFLWNVWNLNIAECHWHFKYFSLSVV